MVPYFSKRLQQRFIRQLGGYRDERVSWEDFKTTLKRDYQSGDKAQRRGTRAFVEAWIRQIHQSYQQRRISLSQYYQTFVVNVEAAIARQQIQAIEKGSLF
jgi:hypothetical protein